MNIKSLECAIREFNEWNGAARLYLNCNDGCFETGVYKNGVDMVQTISTDNYVCVYSKNEFEGNINIGAKRREYVIRFARMILDGVDPGQAEYQLAEKIC